MDVSLHCKPSYTMAVLLLEYGEVIQVERGAMVAMSAGVDVRPGVGSGGVGKALTRKAFGGESFFTGKYQATVDSSWVAVAPAFPGDMSVLELESSSSGVLVEQGAFVAADSGVDVDVRYTGMRSVLLKEGISMLRLSGMGTAVIGSYGGLISYNLSAADTMVVDSAHLVGFDEGIQLKIKLLGGALTSGITGEGLVAEITGPGRVWIQTRSEAALGSWLFPDRSQNER